VASCKQIVNSTKYDLIVSWDSAFYVVYFNNYLTGFWQALLHEKIIVPGDGLALRTMTYVDDTVSALIELMNSKHEKVVSGPVNIGSVKPASLLVSSSVPLAMTLQCWKLHMQWRLICTSASHIVKSRAKYRTYYIFCYFYIRLVSHYSAGVYISGYRTLHCILYQLLLQDYYWRGCAQEAPSRGPQISWYETHFLNFVSCFILVICK
jgi:hypothetical protein